MQNALPLIRRAVLTLVATLTSGCVSQPHTTPMNDLAMSMPMFDSGGFDLTGTNAAFDLAGADGAIATSASNVVPLLVDSGPLNEVYNVASISVRICAPGSTTNCQTIDHIDVDTGSTGLRIISSVVNATVLAGLPSSQVGGDDLTECYTYGSGYVYGTVRTADVAIGGENAAAMPLMIIADPAFSAVPSGCSQGQQSQDTVHALGSNGIIGVNQFSPDCGAECTTVGPGNPIYYACTGTTCTQTGVPLAEQVPNPVSRFATDNNGLIIELPFIDDGGASGATGALVFGIGTQSNNNIDKETIYQASAVDMSGTVETHFNGQTFDSSFFDSGTSDLSFFDSNIAPCTGQLQGLDCPNATETFSATLTGYGGGSGTIGFKVANAYTLLQSSGETAFNDIGDPGIGLGTFVWGLPAFYGHRIFVAMDGATTPKGMGPYYAF